jgi:Rod binding domain-containing protein
MLLVDGYVPASLTLPNTSVAAQSSAPAGLSSHEGAKLRKAAGEFEAILFQSLWKSMKDTFAVQDDENFTPTLESYDDLGIQGMASAVGKFGGLGIKNMILKHLEPMLSGGNHGSPSVS